MPTPPQLLCAALVAGCVMGAPLAEASSRQQSKAQQRHPLMVRLGLEGSSTRQGQAMGFQLGLEGRRWGVSTRLTGLNLYPEDGSQNRDRLRLLDAHVTYSPLSGKRGRLRLEGGVAAARVPGATFIGPSLALSFERCLIGVLDVEGRAQLVPLPHLQLDSQLNMALHLGVLTVRAGWRGVSLNDLGKVDGVTHRKWLGGPFGAIGLNF